MRLAAFALFCFALAACRTPGSDVSRPLGPAGGTGEAALPAAGTGRGQAGEAPPAERYPGARSYSGLYSCDGCIERRLTVTIFADGSYRLREVPVVGQAVDEQGRWSSPSADPDRIVLESSGGMRLLRRTAPDELTLVDPEGRELHGLVGGVLIRLPEVDPLTVSERFVGLYRRAGAQRALVDCATGATLPVVERAAGRNAANRARADGAAAASPVDGRAGESRDSPQAALDAAWAELAPRDDETVLVTVRAHRVAMPLRADGAIGEAIVLDAFERATRNGRCDELPASDR